MKFQSALEFITTYSFMFIIIGVAVLLIFLLANSAKSYVPSRCSGTSGLTCQADSFVTNSVAHNSNVVFALSNAQSVPVNVIGILIKLDPNQTMAGSANGNCAPTFLLPGNTMICSLTFPVTKATGASVSGSYVIYAQFCNVAISQLSNTVCQGSGNYTSVTYGGSFATQVTPGVT